MLKENAVVLAIADPVKRTAAAQKLATARANQVKAELAQKKEARAVKD